MKSRHIAAAYLSNQGDPSAVAWRYMDLEKQVRSNHFLDRVRFFNDLIFQPLYLLGFWILFFIAPGVLTGFGWDIQPTPWNMMIWGITALQVCIRCGSMLSSLLEYWSLSNVLQQWKIVTHMNGGPFIVGPAQYEPLLYADSIARITHSLRRFSEDSLQMSS
jgi:hypothetical protein